MKNTFISAIIAVFALASSAVSQVTLIPVVPEEGNYTAGIGSYFPILAMPAKKQNMIYHLQVTYNPAFANDLGAYGTFYVYDQQGRRVRYQRSTDGDTGRLQLDLAVPADQTYKVFFAVNYFTDADELDMHIICRYGLGSTESEVSLDIPTIFLDPFQIADVFIGKDMTYIDSRLVFPRTRAGVFIRKRQPLARFEITTLTSSEDPNERVVLTQPTFRMRLYNGARLKHVKLFALYYEDEEGNKKLLSVRYKVTPKFDENGGAYVEIQFHSIFSIAGSATNGKLIVEGVVESNFPRGGSIMMSSTQNDWYIYSSGTYGNFVSGQRDEKESLVKSRL